jgi:hypothetical protein
VIANIIIIVVIATTKIVLTTGMWQLLIMSRSTQRLKKHSIAKVTKWPSGSNIL